MTRRKIATGGAIECPACGEDFESGVDLDLHRVEAGPVCPDCGTHVDVAEWAAMAERLSPLQKEGADEEE